MSFSELIVLAVALSMDAAAVAGARGLAAERIRPHEPLLVASLFGGAQALMPALGWAAGSTIASLVVGWGHWVTFGVLVVLGARMVREALAPPGEARDGARPFEPRVLALLAIATSVDALAAGVTFAIRGADVVRACATIGLVTAALSFGGVFLGHRFGARAGRRLDVLGGFVLIGLGVKALVEHWA